MNSVSANRAAQFLIPTVVDRFLDLLEVRVSMVIGGLSRGLEQVSIPLYRKKLGRLPFIFDLE